MAARDDPAEYMRQWRRTPEGRAYLQTQRKRRAARLNAQARLAERHYREYVALLHEEMVAQGLARDSGRKVGS